MYEQVFFCWLAFDTYTTHYHDLMSSYKYTHHLISSNQTLPISMVYNQICWRMTQSRVRASCFGISGA